MSKKSTLPISDEFDEINQEHLNRATFRVGLKPAPRKQRVSIMLDTGVIEFFKKKAGARGYQTMINNALKGIIEGAALEELIRRIVREELAKNEA